MAIFRNFRTEQFGSSFVDINDKIAVNRTALQSLEHQIEEINRNTNEKLDMMFSMLKKLTENSENIQDQTLVGDSNQDLSDNNSVMKPKRQSSEDSRTGPNPPFLTAVQKPYERTHSCESQNGAPVVRRIPKFSLNNRQFSVSGEALNKMFSSSQSIANKGLHHDHSYSSQAYAAYLNHMLPLRERDYLSITDHIEIHYMSMEPQRSSMSSLGDEGDDIIDKEKRSEKNHLMAVTEFMRRKFRYSSYRRRRGSRRRRREVEDDNANPGVKIQVGSESDEDDNTDGQTIVDNNHEEEINYSNEELDFENEDDIEDENLDDDEDEDDDGEGSRKASNIVDEVPVNDDDVTLSQLLSSNSSGILQDAFNEQALAAQRQRASNSNHKSSSSSVDTLPRSPIVKPFSPWSSEAPDASSQSQGYPTVGKSSFPAVDILSCLVEESAASERSSTDVQNNP